MWSTVVPVTNVSWYYIQYFNDHERTQIRFAHAQKTLYLALMRRAIAYFLWNYNDVIIGATTSQITSFTIVYSTVYSGANKRKHQSSASLAFVRGIHRWPMNSPHEWPVTRKMFPFDDIMGIWESDRIALYISEYWCPLPWDSLIYGRGPCYYRPGFTEPNRTPRTILSNDGVNPHGIYQQ